MELLKKYGRMSLIVRPHLRVFVSLKNNRNEYINDLIEKDAKKKPVESQDKDRNG